MPRVTRAPRTASLAVIALLLAAPLPALAQASPAASPAPTPFVASGMCILEAAEVADLLGRPGAYDAELDFDGCAYSGSGAYLALDWRTWYDLEHDADADGEEVTVAGHPGWYDAGSTTLYIDTGYRTYGIYLTLDGEGAALERIVPIAEVVMPRYDARDQASPAHALAALFPSELGGVPVEVALRMSGPEWLGDMPDEQRSQVEEMVAAQGATIADLGIASGSTESGALLSAVRIAGGSAADFAVPLLTIAAGGDPGMSVEPTTVAGKEVLVVSVPDEESTITVYPSGEVVWLLMMDDAVLDEALGKLP